MSRMKRLAVQQLDVSKDYLVIGLDLAKTDTAVIAITTDGELYAIDRLKYSDSLLSKIICSLTLASTFTVNPGPRKLKVINKPLLIK